MAIHRQAPAQEILNVLLKVEGCAKLPVPGVDYETDRGVHLLVLEGPDVYDYQFRVTVPQKVDLVSAYGTRPPVLGPVPEVTHQGESTRSNPYIKHDVFDFV